MPRVESSQKLANLCPPALANDETVGAHTQGFSHQARQVNTARALSIGLPALQRHTVWVADGRLGNVFDHDDAIRGSRFAEPGRHKRGLAAAGGSGEQHRVTVVQRLPQDGYRPRLKARLSKGYPVHSRKPK
jgi:hypothetical protein